jgi:hypothetical protein
MSSNLFNFKVCISLLSMLSFQVFAASSGTLNLSGVVAVVNEISVNAQSQATTLDIEAGESNLLVADVQETSNNLAGYTIQLYSLNAGELQNASDASKKTNYQLSYDGGSLITPPSTSSPLTVKTVSSLAGRTTNSSQVKVNVTPYTNAPAGTYSDVVTFSIVAN